MNMRRKVLASGLALVVAPGLAKSAVEGAVKAAAETIEVKTTLENLMVAFNGESNASARYVAFAKKADQDGYGKVASLFRAAAKAESIHAQNHAVVIKALSGKAPKAELKPVEVKTTKENLEAAIKGETYEFKVMYPAYLTKAKSDRNRSALRTITFAKNTEGGHAKLYTDALNNLEAWKGPNVEFYVCKECGNTVEKIDFEKCPICSHPKDYFLAVK